MTLNSGNFRAKECGRSNDSWTKRPDFLNPHCSTAVRPFVGEANPFRSQGKHRLELTVHFSKDIQEKPSSPSTGNAVFKFVLFSLTLLLSAQVPLFNIANRAILLPAC